MGKCLNLNLHFSLQHVCDILTQYVCVNMCVNILSEREQDFQQVTGRMNNCSGLSFKALLNLRINVKICLKTTFLVMLVLLPVLIANIGSYSNLSGDLL